MNGKSEYPDVPWLGPEYFENRQKFPIDDLLQYQGQYIAWTWDGSRILASDPDWDELDRKLVASGFDPGRVVHEYVDPAGASYF